ncbi:hypothetical protein Areg01_88440 [Actinoplanes regularis]|nr:hypothetical protein Areg01_88440 [Actinoplanes regularis]
MLEASDGPAALRIARDDHPDLVVADVLMPGMDGYEFVHELRQDPGTTELPVLFYTANYREDEIRGIAEAYGVSRVVIKDDGPDSLVRAVGEAFTHPVAQPAPDTLEATRDHLRTVNAKLVEKVHALAESDERFRVIAEAAPVGIVLGDRDGHATYVNPALQRMTRRTADELLHDGWLVCLSASNRGPAHLIARGPTSHTRRFDRHRVTLSDDHTVWVTSTLSTITDDDETTGFIVVVDDVTTEMIAEQQRREYEEQQQEAVRQEAADRFASLARLASGVAHDFNNVLNIVMSSTDLVSDIVSKARDSLDTTDADDVLTALNRMKQAGKRAADLSHQMLTIGGEEIVKPSVVDGNDAVREVRDMVASVIGDDITVRTVLDPALRPTLIDEGRLGQVLLNLAINARDAMPGGGELRFETANLDARESAQIAGLDGTEHVRLSVIDTGTGMPPDVARRAIEPFFTTKPSGRGTGLGLATSYGLVKQAGGQLVIDTAEGRGTAVHLYLPAA